MTTYTYVTLSGVYDALPRGINDFGVVSGNGDLYEAGTYYPTVIVPNEETLPILTGMNNFDQFVGYYYDQADVPHSFLATAAGITAVINDPLSGSGQPTDPGEYATFVDGINDQGETVGYYTNQSGVYGFLHTGTDYTTGYTTIEDPLSSNVPFQGGYPDTGTIVTGINDSGVIVGYYYDSAGQTHGFSYLNGIYETLDDGTNTKFTGINNLGEIIGYSSTGDFIYSNETFTQISGLPGPPTGINDAGQIVGYVSNNPGFPAYLASPGAQPPAINAASSVLTGVVNKVADEPTSIIPDSTQGFISFTDADLATTTATVSSESLVWTNAQGQIETIPAPIDVPGLEHGFQLGSVSSSGGEGSVNWTYAVPNAALSWLGVGDTLTLTSTVQINDGQGNTTDQPIVVTIKGADDLPVLSTVTVADGAGQTVSADASSGVVSSSNASDPVLEDVLTVGSVGFAGIAIGPLSLGANSATVTSGTPGVVHGEFGTLTLDAVGGFTYVNTLNPALENLLLRFSGGTLSDTFAFTVNDGFGGAATSTLTVDITASPPPTSSNPVVVPVTAPVQIGQTLIAGAAQGALAGDSDPNGYRLAISAVDGSAANVGIDIPGKFGTLKLNSDGSYTYVETSTAVQSGAQDVFDITVSDRRGNSASTTLGISISAAPTGTLTHDVQVSEATINEQFLINGVIDPGHLTSKSALVPQIGKEINSAGFLSESALEGFPTDLNREGFPRS